MAQEFQEKLASDFEDSDESILELMRSRFKSAVEAEEEIRRLALEDQRFVAGEQWPAALKNAREQDSRPCLTINRVAQSVKQVTNDQRQNRPSFKISPVDNGADPETASVIQGLFRHIQHNSNADIAFDTAFEGAVKKSFGFYRVTTDYCDPLSFDQEILIKQIPNHFSVYLDPTAKEPDGSDAKWGIIFDEMSRDEFRAQYPDAKCSNLREWQGVGDVTEWVNKNTVRVAEYFRTVYEKDELVEFSNGIQLLRSKITDGLVPAGVTEERTREVLVPQIKWILSNGDEILERADWGGRYVPIFPVYGNIEYIDGKKQIESLTRHAKDPQMMYNFFVSSETEAIALAPKAPFIVAEGQIPPEYKHQWENANIKNYSHLTYKPISVAGQPVGAPQRNSYEPPVQALTNARLQSADDIKATTGIYDASLGNKSNETSGIAIQRRNQQAQTSNFHFIDNFNRTLKHCGKVILDLIPVVYDAERTIRIIGDDSEEQVVTINGLFKDKNGKEKKHFLNIGKYDVIIDSGPSIQTKRQEAVTAMIEMAKAMPQQLPVFADLMLGNMDFPGASEMAKRIKKTVDPKFLDEKDQPQGPNPEQLQMQLQQMGAAMEQMQAQLQEANQVLNTKAIEIESKERIAFAEMQNKLAIEEAKIKASVDSSVFKEQVAMLHAINGKLESLGVAPVVGEEIPNENFNEPGDEAAVQNNGDMQ
jgi:hypothetical protein